MPEDIVRAVLKAPGDEHAWVLLERLATRPTLNLIDDLSLDELKALMRKWEAESEITIPDLFRLVSLLSVSRHREALAADLIAKGMRLRWFPSDEHNWSDLKTVVKYLGVHTSLYGAVYPERAGWDTQNMLLASISDGITWLQWAQTKDGKKGRNRPKLIPRPGVVDEQRDGAKVKAAPLSQVKAKFAKRYAEAANAAMDTKKNLAAGLGRRVPVAAPEQDRLSTLTAAFHGRR